MFKKLHFHQTSRSDSYDNENSSTKKSEKGVSEDEINTVIKTQLLAIPNLRLSKLEPQHIDSIVEWLKVLNKNRITKGYKPVVTYGVIIKCPLWKIIPIPYKGRKQNV